jgi:hypothetical protein
MSLFAAAPGSRLERAAWKASWITAAGAPERDPVVLHFRKAITLPAAPARFVVHVSADNRFLLHDNGARAGAGPARGDVEHWRYQTIDLAPMLKPGRNLVAATVWNFGVHAPLSQVGRRTGFLLQGDDEAAEALDTDDTWQVEIDAGHAPNPAALESVRKRFFYAAGPGEIRDGARWDWDWDRDGSKGRWQPALPIFRGTATPRTIRDASPSGMSPGGWLLVPDPLPAMEHRPVPVGKVVRQEGSARVEGAFPDGGRATVPARAQATLLLDRRELVNAYPELLISGGRGATVRLRYAESLFDAEGRKGNRDEIAGKQVLGVYDELAADGGRRAFAPLWWRSWRYLQIEATTAGEPLVIEGVKASATGFPLALRARFAADDPQLGPLWQMAFRTLRVSAHETYMDSPYWEQLQYVGDTRITALLSYVMANEDRLARQAILAFDDSRTADGLTMSRWPTRDQQYIPPYSLFWIGMVHDFWMYRGDEAFVRARLPGTRTVLDWFLRRQRADGLLGYVPWWSHVDPVAGGARQDDEGGSAAVTGQLVAALREAIALETAFGDRARVVAYRAAEQRALRGLRGLWDAGRGLLRDRPGVNAFSHDVNILALWLDVLPAGQRARLLDEVLALGRKPPAVYSGRPGESADVRPASLYFRYYLTRAVDHAGRGDAFLELLAPWRQMLGMGLSTLPEFSDPTRSDSHAWTGHPAYDFLTVVAGIRPAAPGFARVRIEPHLAALKTVDAAVPHPRGGEVAVSYKGADNALEARVSLPAGVPGELVWRGRSHALPAGASTTLTLR